MTFVLFQTSCKLTRGTLAVNLYTCLICHMIDLSNRRIVELLGVVPRNLQTQ